jgi:hypothetical protein
MVDTNGKFINGILEKFVENSCSSSIQVSSVLEIKPKVDPEVHCEIPSTPRRSPDSVITPVVVVTENADHVDVKLEKPVKRRLHLDALAEVTIAFIESPQVLYFHLLENRFVNRSEMVCCPINCF